MREPPWQQNQRTTSTIEMFQDRFGQRPLTRTDSTGKRLPEMIVNVWNLRFMQSELGDPASELPLVSSSLQLVKVGSVMRIRGTISNRAAAQNLRPADSAWTVYWPVADVCARRHACSGCRGRWRGVPWAGGVPFAGASACR